MQDIRPKICDKCGKIYACSFQFCPLDGSTLSEPPVPDKIEPQRELFSTVNLRDKGLIRSLAENLVMMAEQVRLAWPEFKSDPWVFSKRSMLTAFVAVKQYFSRPNVVLSWSLALTALLSLSLVLIVLDHRSAAKAAKKANEELELTQMISNIPDSQSTPDEGTAGMAKGDGGGSKPKQEKAGGGGGGGREELKPASTGKLPQADLRIPQVVAPDPHPPTVKNPALPMPATLDADPVLFPPDTRQLNYGDPKSKSTDTSSGPGTGNGIGTGTGGGVGPGTGGGYGPGNGGNTGGGDRREGGGGPGGGGGGTDYTRVFSGKEVNSKARVLTKPEPTYTEAARKDQITGTVIIRAVFAASGAVTNIHVTSGLPDGLSERAIAAAKAIKFVPAMKDGHPVSMWMELQYNFNLY